MENIIGKKIEFYKRVIGVRTHGIIIDKFRGTKYNIGDNLVVDLYLVELTNGYTVIVHPSEIMKILKELDA